jgi:glycosyltransferase involved in cell wall biosynthesis
MIVRPEPNAPRKVVFAGPLPPPSHGMANMNQRMVALIAEHTQITAFGVQPSALRRGLNYHLAKTGKALAAALGIARARASGTTVFYGSVDDGLGGIWTLLFVIVARAMGLQIFLHHHSYKYILERAPVMRAIVFVAGPHARHIMLCDDMITAFSGVYPRAKHFISALNSVPEPAREMAKRDPTATGVTIGLLSNLTREKGLRTFVQLLEECNHSELRGILAGPIPNSDDQEFVRLALNRLDGRLVWMGAVADEKKEAFFEQLDLFVFPTTYPTEAFGLVLLEALVRGVPCVAPKRGCICVFEKLSSVEVVPLANEFALAARQRIAALLEDPTSLPGMKAIAQKEGRELNGRHECSQISLAERICGLPERAAA